MTTCDRRSVVFSVWRTPPDMERTFRSAKHLGVQRTTCDLTRGHDHPWRHEGVVDGVRVTWFDMDYRNEYVDGHPYYQLVDGRISRAVKPGRVG